MSRQLVDTWYGAFREGDIEKLPLADDFVHLSPFGEIRGRESYLDMVRANADTFFGHAIDILEVFDCGDRFAVRYTVGGMQVCECIYTRDGQIARIHAYYHFGERPVLPALRRWYGG